MATYDNKHWLLSHIRNSFISTDDTGMCETVMLGEDFPKLLHAKCVAERGTIEISTPPKTEDDSGDEKFEREKVMEFECYPELDQDDDDDIDPLTESYDPQHDMDFGLHSAFNRQRSNTAQKLEKMELAQRKAAKIKVVKWEDPPNVLSSTELEHLFSRKEVKPSKTKGKSLLTDQLEKCPFLPQSKYLEYAKFDGTAQCGLPTKTYKIFMTMVPEDKRNYPVQVSIVASAKIIELIGFICYKYSIQHPDITLGSVPSYGLYICEDDGEVDLEFPCLDAKEACSKFGFTCLGLVDMKSNPPKNCDIQTSSIPEKSGFNVIHIPDDKSNEQSMRSRSATFDFKEKQATAPTVFQIGKMPSAIKTEKSIQETSSNVTFGSVNLRNSQPFHLQAKKWLETELDSTKCLSSSPQETEALNRMKVHEKVIEAPLYQSYRVRVASRVRASTQILLGISGERIEIDPVVPTSNKFWARMKPVSYNMDSIAWCEMIEIKSNKSTFRIIYSLNSNPSPSQEPSFSNAMLHYRGLLNTSTTIFKHHDFECESSIAKEIVEKLNRILKLQSSSCRKEYMAARERKFQARRSFHIHKSS